MPSNGRLMEPILDAFPIAKVDYTTARELLPMLLGSQPFSTFDAAPDLQAMIAEAEQKMGRRLSDEERRALAARLEFYRTGDYLVRHFGRYAMGLSLKSPVGRVIMHKLGAIVACAVLAEVYFQKRTTEITISKQKLLAYLGYSTREKQAYQDLRETLNALRWLEYKLWFPSDHFQEGMVGNFIYNLAETRKQYVLDVNEKFVGCVAHLFDSTHHTSKERKRLFGRGFFELLTKTLPLSRRYPAHGRALLLYVLREQGNQHHNTLSHKVIVQRIASLVEDAGPRRSRSNASYHPLIQALELLVRDHVIDRIEPGLETLKHLPPREGLRQQIRLYVLKPKALDRQLGQRLAQESNLFGAKQGSEVIFPVQKGAKSNLFRANRLRNSLR